MTDITAARTYRPTTYGVATSRFGLLRAIRSRRVRRAGSVPIMGDVQRSRHRALILLCVACVLVSVLLMVGAAAEVLYAQGARGMCHTEDSTSCVWVPALQGNGHGSPALIVNGPDQQ